MSVQIKSRSVIGTKGHRIFRKFGNHASHLLRNLAQLFQAQNRRRSDRKAVRELLTFTDEQLRDIGLAKNDVIFASKLTENYSATQELQKIARHKN